MKQLSKVIKKVLKMATSFGTVFAITLIFLYFIPIILTLEVYQDNPWIPIVSLLTLLLWYVYVIWWIYKDALGKKHNE